jgi:DNA-binding transcriptional MerR regulator
VYGPNEIARLQQVRSLQALGFPLKEIKALLDGGQMPARQVVRLHAGRLRERIDLLREAEQRLEGVARWLDASGEAPVDELLSTLEVMSRMERYYTAEQLEQLKARREQVGEERIREVEAEWPLLIAEVKAEMDAATDPASSRVQDLARRWKGLVEEFTGGDPGVAASLQRVYQNEPAARERVGLDPALFEYVRSATAATQGPGDPARTNRP